MDAMSTDLSVAQLSAAKGLTPATGRKLDAAARDFEAVFISQMLETAWSTVPTDGPMSGGSGESVFRSIMIQDIGKQMAQQGGLGLADRVRSELLAIQEKNSR
jgi:Rod binding domain-containing protein